MNILKENIKNYPDVGAFFAFLTVGILAFLFGDKTLGIICLAIAIGWEYARRVAPRIDYAMIGIWLVIAISQFAVGLVYAIGGNSVEKWIFIVGNVLAGLAFSASMKIREDDEDYTRNFFGMQIAFSIIGMFFTAGALFNYETSISGMVLFFVHVNAIVAYARVTSDWHISQARPERISPLVSLWRLVRPIHVTS